MQLSAYIAEAGYEIESVETKCDVDFQDGSVVGSHLKVHANKGISDADFQEFVTKGAELCYLLLNTKLRLKLLLA
jgi:osmotically inducible protein OsmC